MSKTLKIVFAVIAALAIAVTAGVIAFKTRYGKMAQDIVAEHAKISKVNLAKIPDGIYDGEFKNFLVNVKVAVEIKKHRIKSVVVKEQHAGPGYEALDTTERIVKAQSPKVDAVSGATGSSMGIMIAAHNALESAKNPPTPAPK